MGSTLILLPLQLFVLSVLSSTGVSNSLLGPSIPRLSSVRATYGSLTQLRAGFGYGLFELGATVSLGGKFSGRGVVALSSFSSPPIPDLSDRVTLEPDGEEGSGTFLAEMTPIELRSLSVESSREPIEVD